MKINFEKLPCYTSIKKDVTILQDVKFQLANLLYTLGNGIAHGALALKIYNANGDEDYNEQEIKTLIDFSKTFTPIFQDSLNDYIKNNR